VGLRVKDFKVSVGFPPPHGLKISFTTTLYTRLASLFIRCAIWPAKANPQRSLYLTVTTGSAIADSEKIKVTDKPIQVLTRIDTSRDSASPMPAHKL